MGKLNEEVVFMSQDDIELVRSAIQEQIKDKGKLEKKLDRCVKLEGILVKLPKKQEDIPPLLKACGYEPEQDVVCSDDIPVGDSGIDTVLADLMGAVNGKTDQNTID